MGVTSKRRRRAGGASVGETPFVSFSPADPVTIRRCSSCAGTHTVAWRKSSETFVGGELGYFLCPTTGHPAYVRSIDLVPR